MTGQGLKLGLLHVYSQASQIQIWVLNFKLQLYAYAAVLSM